MRPVNTRNALRQAPGSKAKDREAERNAAKARLYIALWPYGCPDSLSDEMVEMILEDAVSNYFSDYIEFQHLV